MRTNVKDRVVAVTHSIYNILAPRLPARRTLPADAFEALEGFFDEIWVLTISRSLRRQEAFTRAFSGLRYSFHNGVDGKALPAGDPRVDLEQARTNNRRAVGINELACTLSHLQMFEEVARRGLRRVMVFEDDAVPDRNASRWVPYCLERLPECWDLLYMGYRDAELRGFLTELRERLPFGTKDTRVVSRTVGRGLRTAGGHDFTHAYAISQDGARKLLAGAYPVCHTADGWLEHRVLSGELNAYVTVPKLFHQVGTMGSSIHGTST